MHLHNKLLQCTNDLTTLTDIMKLHKLWDIFYIHCKMKFKSHIYIEVPLKMAARSTSPRRQNLLHGAKSTESTEPPAGCTCMLQQNVKKRYCLFSCFLRELILFKFISVCLCFLVIGHPGL